MQPQDVMNKPMGGTDQDMANAGEIGEIHENVQNIQEEKKGEF